MIEMPKLGRNKTSLAALASVVVALVVMGIKYVAYLATGSVALYSDALESIVNVLTAIAALVAIEVSSRPPDRHHPFGHHKAEYFAAVLEGVLIVVASLMIMRQAANAFLQPQPMRAPLTGLAINGAATALNAAWAWFLLSRGRAWRSPALMGGAQHVSTDVWTSLAVLAGLGLAFLTNWTVLDPLLASAVALNILWTGFRLTRESMSSLMDEAVGAETDGLIRETIRANGAGALQVHDLRTRSAGRATFIEFHLVVPGEMTVQDSHAICDRVEDALRLAVDGSQITIHVEPQDKAKAKGAVEI